MKKLTLIAMCAIGLNATSQSERLKKADNYFGRLSYAYAANSYEKLLNTEESDTELKRKLAYSYMHIQQNKKAIDLYAQIVELPDATSEDYYNYAFLLKMIGNYTESDLWMQKFAQKCPNDSRTKLYLLNKDYKTQIEEQPSFFNLQNTKLNSAASDFGGYINPAQNKVYVVSSRKSNRIVQHENMGDGRRFLDIYQASYSANGETGKVKKVKKVNTKFHEGPLAFSADGKTVYFTRNNISQGNKRRDLNKVQNLKIYIADVDSKGRFVNEREFPFNSKDYSVGHPAITKDGKTMYFVSDKPGGLGATDIYKVEILGPNSFGEMVNLGPQINTEGKEMFPFIDAKNRLFFSSDGRPGLGGLDVYVTEVKGSTYSKILNVGVPINTRFDDFSFNLSENLQRGYLSSNRSGHDDIYSIDALKDIKFGVRVEGLAKDKKGNVVPNATVKIFDTEGQLLATMTTDENGVFYYDSEPNKELKLEGTKEKYFPGNTTVSTNTTESEVKTSLILEKDPGMSLYAVVRDSKTLQPLEGVKVTLVDNFSDKAKKITTPISGDLLEPLNNKKLNDRGSYNIILEKEGYFSKTVTYNVVFNKEGKYEVSNEIDLTMEAEVKDLGELIKINPINFDLNKAIIRPDAAKELDKIVDIMNRYPHLVIELGAHTDCRGTKAANLTLSQKRATASAEYIKKRITSPERIFGKGYGESKLLNDCGCEGNVVSNCSEDEHALNRRTEFRVIATGNDKLKVEKPTVDSFE